MKEVVFINRNIKKWKNFEGIIYQFNKIKPDVVADLFIEITDDLAYARTYYPESNIVKYLNSLGLKVHQLIYKNKKEKKGSIQKFWIQDFPLLMYEYRKQILYSAIIFLIATFIGIISAKEDVDFVRLIMGDEYIEMTKENIANKDPMAVYKNATEMPMFLGITINNIRVSFFAFVLGIFFSVGTGWILFTNGIMLGSFHYFMFQQGVLKEAMLAIWMHGCLEIFAIIIAGTAGLVLGNSILFPKTFSRLVSLKKGVADGVKIALGLMPIFITAGFIEGFITRYTNAPDWFRIIFISSTIVFIVWYFFIYPRKIFKKFQFKII